MVALNRKAAQFRAAKNFAAACVLCALSVLPLCAQSFAVSGKASLSSGVLRAQGVTKDDKSQWVNSATNTIQFDAAPIPEIKTVTAISSTMSTFSNSIALERAYLKARLPRFGSVAVRLSAGRMPLAWGHGTYFNAGDIIFGSAPLTSGGFDTNAYRAATAWLACAQIAAGSMFFTEVAAVPEISFFTEPEGTDIISVYNKKETAVGGRAVFQPQWTLLDSAEAGMLASPEAETVSFYAAADGTAFIDYNICAASKYNKKNSSSESEQLKQNMELSAALFWAGSFSGELYDHTLSLRGETLWQPDKKLVQLFSLASFTFTDSISASCSWSSVFAEKTESMHTVSASINWEPLQGLELAVQGAVAPKDPKTLSSAAVSVTYHY